jgi:hypothetical protein
MPKKTEDQRAWLLCSRLVGLVKRKLARSDVLDQRVLLVFVPIQHDALLWQWHSSVKQQLVELQVVDEGWRYGDGGGGAWVCRHGGLRLALSDRMD